MAAEAPARLADLTDADREELARLLCRGLFEVWLRRGDGEGRAPHRLDARPPGPRKEKHGGPSTGCPEDILRP